nr:putative ribonuclease H-like domain-containing protein [Tanacetum cinerariifolium]
MAWRCRACKQHKAFYKAINAVSSISKPLQLLHIDLFGPTSIRSIDHKYYCLVITDDYSRFCWVFFLAHKDETYPILKDFINLVENQLNKKVKAIRYDNGTEFKNAHMIELCGSKGIKREYSNPRAPQQNKVAERKNKTLIEAARTILADSKLPTMFWTEAVRTACYVLNRVSVTSPYNKTPYALLTANIPSVNHFKPFGCHVTIFNTSDHLGKFDGKADEGYIVGYSASNKAYRVYNVPNKRVEESMNLRFLKEKPYVQGLGHECSSSSSNDSMFDGEHTTRFLYLSNLGNHDPSPGIFSFSSYDDELDTALNNVASFVEVSPVETKRINTIHPQSLIIKDPTSVVQTRSKVKQNTTGDSAFISYIFDQQRDNHKDFQHCLFACFLSQVEPRSVAQALEDPSWVNAMQEEMQQFKFQNIWVLVDLPASKYAIGTKWILKNKRDARGIVVHNKAKLVAQGHQQEEGIDYDEVFAPVSRIEAIRLFLAFASYMGFLVYQMDVKSVFLYGRIDEEVYVTQPKGFVDPQHPKKVYKVVKALYGLHQAPRAWYATLSTFLLKHGYKRGTIDKTLFFKKNNRDIILVQVYVDDIIFGSTKKAWCDEFEALMKGEFQMSAMGELTFFLVSACSWHQVTPTTSNLEAVKKIFKYLKGQSKLGLWYPKESPLVLKAYSNSDYAGANKDRKSTTGGCQFLGALDTKSVVRLWPNDSKRWISAFQVLNMDHVALIWWQCIHTGSARVPSGVTRVPAGYYQLFMAALKYKEEHNKVGYLLKPTRSNDYHNIIDFLRSSHITAPELGPPAILASIDKTPYTITKELVRSRHQLADDGGIADLPIPEIYSGMDNLGYVTKGKLTFFKNKFSPQWRFLVHTLLHCLSTKSGSWDQFGSLISIALICLSDRRHFNWSNYIFRGMVSNIKNARKFLMYPRFLQTILAIETRVTRQYKVLVFSSKLFANMRLNFAGHPMPLLPAMLLQAQAGEGAAVAAQDVPHPMPAPDQSPAHLPIPSKPQTSDPVAPVLKHSHSSNPHETTAGSFPNREDEPLGGDFHTSPPRSSQAPPAGQPLGGAEDPITLTALSFVVSTLIQKVHLLKAELHDHKRLFKDVVGKLVKSPCAPTAVLPATSGVPTCASVVPPSDLAVPPSPSAGPSGDSTVPSGTFVVPPAASAVTTGASTIPAEEDIPVKARTFKQMEEDRLGEEAAKRLHDEEMAQLERERTKVQRKRQQEVLDSAMYYNEFDWLNIRTQVKANASLSKTLLGPVLEEPSAKRPKSPEAPTPSMPAVLPTPLGEINSLYRIDGSTKNFATLRQILHMVDRQDLMKLYGLVVQYYETHPVVGARMLFWGDLQVLSMFTDVSYPLSVVLMEKMLMHKLEIDLDFVGNDLTTAEQLV